MSKTLLSAPATCGACAFTTADVVLLANHSCETQARGGYCEDYPACGHERGDCNGQRYGSDAAIQEAYLERLSRGDDDWDYE